MKLNEIKVMNEVNGVNGVNKVNHLVINQVIDRVGLGFNFQVNSVFWHTVTICVGGYVRELVWTDVWDRVRVLVRNQVMISGLGGIYEDR